MAVVRRVPVPAGTLVVGPLQLGPAAAHYLGAVLRVQEGAPLTLTDGAGKRARATWLGAGRVEVAAVEDSPPLTLPTVRMACGLSKGDKLDFLTEKLSELGAHSLWAVECRRSVVKLDGDRAEARRARWERVAEAAARQCGRDRALEVDGPVPLTDLLALPHGGTRLVLVPGAPPLTSCLPADWSATGEVLLLTGPEGGLAEEEVAQARTAGFVAAGLGPLTLRAETAPLAAVAAVLARAGVL